MHTQVACRPLFGEQMPEGWGSNPTGLCYLCLLKDAGRSDSGPREFPYPGPVPWECFRLRTTPLDPSLGKVAPERGLLFRALAGTRLPQDTSPLPHPLAQTLAGTSCSSLCHLGHRFSRSLLKPLALIPLLCCDDNTGLAVLQAQVQILLIRWTIWGK